jgi:uncharacterized protein (UPF0548 family)
MTESLSRLDDLALSYPEVGATGHALPADARHLVRDVEIGNGEQAFRRAAEALMTWRMHTGAGARVQATAERAAVGVNLLVCLGPSWAQLEAPCRVLHVIEQPDRIGFTYGTLTGHPVSGEESFSVLAQGDVVRFVLIGFARPSRSLAGTALRLSGPIGRSVTDAMLDRYARALRHAARSR